MKITLISASTRAGSQSRKVTDYLQKRLEDMGVATGLVDLYEQKLPLYDDTKEGPWKPTWKEMSQELATADGLVFVSPEWDGMASAGLFNMIHYLDDEVAHKPAMLVGVSDGLGGAYPIAQMKMMGQKNKKFVIIPENLRFAKVTEALVDGQITIEGLTARVEYSLKMLIEYTKALQSVRSSGVVDSEKWDTGV